MYHTHDIYASIIFLHYTLYHFASPGGVTPSGSSGGTGAGAGSGAIPSGPSPLHRVIRVGYRDDYGLA